MSDTQEQPAPAGIPGDSSGGTSGGTSGGLRLALLGDIHVYRLWVAPWRLFGKRVAAQTNLWFHRRKAFESDRLAPALQRAASIRPDMLLMSGDFTTTSLPQEFADVRQVLDEYTAGLNRLAIPGNHDRYTLGSVRRRLAERALASMMPPSFPHFQRLTPNWLLVALDSARQSAFNSRGRLGRQQIATALAMAEQQLHERDGVVVLCHYPFAVPPGVHWPWHHRLGDADDLRDLLAHWTQSLGARVLFLHGHVHRPWHWEPMPGVLDINAGSPTRVSRQFPLGQGFWQIDLPADAQAPVALSRHVPAPGPDGGTLWRAEPVL